MSNEHSHIVTLPVLLVDQARDLGVVADLTLTLQRGSGLFGPAPEQSNLTPHDSFSRAATNAQQVIGLPKEWDVLWRLARRDRQPISRLTGGSLGAAFAIGSAKLLAINGIAVPRQDRTTLIKLNLSQVAISAQIKSDGALARVGGIPYKLQAAFSEFSPRIHTVVVTEDQKIKLEEPNSHFHLLRAGTLSEAIALIHSDYQSGWGEIIDCSEALGEPVEIQGQETLKKELEAFLAERESGYFLVVGGEGSGKSAFVADAVRKNPTAVYHLIRKRKKWNNPDAITRSLMNQLRRKHGVDVEGETLYDVLNKVSRKLKGERREKEVLLWVDGLDRIYGPEVRYPDRSLSDLLPVRLPEGVFIVFTSRPGAHLDALADPEVCKRVRLGKETGEEKIGPRERAHRDVVDALGLLAAGQEPLRLEDLTAFFGSERADQMKEVITLAQEFFSGGATADPQSPLQFYHTSFREFLLDEAKERIEFFHQTLAKAGENWQELNGHAREYALRHLPAHQRKGGMWEKLTDTLLDLKYVEERIENKGAIAPLFDLLGDYYESLEGEEALPKRKALRGQVEALGRALNRESYVLKETPSLLGQQLYNALVWHWDETTRLGRGVRALASQSKRPWLKQRREPNGIGNRGPLRTLTGHTGFVLSVAITPDGKRIVSGGDNTVRVWEGESGKEIRTLFGHSHGVRSVAITPDGKRIVSGGADNTVRVWDGGSGKEIRTLTGHSHGVRSVAITPDGKRIVSGGADDTVRVWDGESGKEIRTLFGHSHGVNSVAITPDGKRIVSGGNHNIVCVWDGESGKEIRTLFGHSGVNSIAITPDGKWIVSGGADGTIWVWEARGRKEIRIVTGHTGYVRSVAITSDGKRIVSGGDDRTIRVWKARSGKKIRTFTGHTDELSSVAITPDGKRIVSGGDDNTVRVWEAGSGNKVQTFIGHTDELSSVAITPDGKRIVSGGNDNKVRVWDGESGKKIRTLFGHTRCVRSVAITPDGKWIVSGGDDNKVRVWDGESGKKIRTLTGHTGWVNSVAITWDGKRIVSGGNDGTIRVWETRSGKKVQTFKDHWGWVNSVAITPDGKRIVSGGDDRSIRVWKAGSGKKVQTFIDYIDEEVRSVAITPDGKRIVSGGADGTIQVWEARNGKEVQTFKGHKGWVNSVAITPDGKRIVSGGDDGSIRVWEARNGKEISYLPYVDWVLAVSFHPIARCLLVVDTGGATGSPNVYVFEIVEPYH